MESSNGTSNIEHRFIQDFLKRDDLDMLLPHVTMTHGRYKTMDFTACTDTMVTGFVLPAVKINNNHADISKPFSTTVRSIRCFTRDYALILDGFRFGCFCSPLSDWWSWCWDWLPTSLVRDFSGEDYFSLEPNYSMSTKPCWVKVKISFFFSTVHEYLIKYPLLFFVLGISRKRS